MGNKAVMAIVAVAVVVGAIFLVSSRQPAENINPEPASVTVEQPVPGTSGVEEMVVRETVKDGTYEVAPAESKVNWEGRKTLIKDYKDTGTLSIKEGSFSLLNGEASGKIVFDMSSLAVSTTGKQSGEPMLEKHLKSDDFFGVEKFPTAEFVLKSATPAADVATSNQYTLKGDLTMKGITHEIEFPATVYLENGMLRAQATTEIDRTKWDIRFGSDKFFDNLANNVIDDNFTVSFDLAAKGA